MQAQESGLSTPPLENEQTEGLLSDWQDGQRDQTQKKRGLSTKITPLLLIAFVVVTVITTAKLLIKPTSSSQRVAAEVTSNDYILEGPKICNNVPAERKYTWVVRDQLHNPDGFFRRMILVNNQFPGPLIEACEGDSVEILVANDAQNATSIHWHGIYQNGTANIDGAIGVTQTAISPGNSFRYRFTLSGQTGTYWWHAHQAVQSSDGVHGPLIIHSRDNPTSVPYDTDRVILVSDHYHTLSSAQLGQYLQPNNENNEPVPVGGLVNGRGIHKCADTKRSRHSSPAPSSASSRSSLENTCKHTSNVGYPRVQLAPGKAHRLRIINAGAFAEFQVQLDEHELTMIEVEGTDIQPVAFKRIRISPAQRYSVVVQMQRPSSTTVQPASRSFWFRARMIVNCFADGPRVLRPGSADEQRTPLDPDALAIVQSDDEDATGLPTSSDWEDGLAQQCTDMNSSDLVPLTPISPPPATAFFYLQTSVQIRSHQLARLYFNDSTYQPATNPSTPLLSRALTGMHAHDPAFLPPPPPPDSSNTTTTSWINSLAFDASSELVLQTTGLQTPDILLSNLDDGAHPIHLHGHKFFVLAQGHGYPPRRDETQDLFRANLDPLYDTLVNTRNPLRRDTAVLEAYGWMLLRVVADNVGAWALHCHVTWHAEAGLVMVLLSRTDEMARR